MSWQKQSEDDKYVVKVSGDYCHDGTPRTDFLFIDKETGEHSHASVSDEGELTWWHDEQ